MFRSFSRTELDFVTRFKSGEMKVEGGATVLMSGTRSPHLFTVLSGWGYREKTLEDGRRSILNFVLPGDLVGLQSALFCEMNHSVEALTDMTLCVFQRSDIEALFRREPGLAFTVVWHAARAERILDEHLLSVGRRSAAERIAYLMVFLLERARGLDLVEPGGVIATPITQGHVADALGLSLVHTNKTVKRLAARQLVSWKPGRLTIRDEDGLRVLAAYDRGRTEALPLI